MILRCAVVLVLILSTGHLLAQKQGQALLDSLVKVLPKQKEDTNKVKVLNDLCLGYHVLDPDTGIAYGKQALALAAKLDYAAGKAWAGSHIGLNYAYQSDYPTAMEYYGKAAKIFEQTGNKRGIAWVAMCTGNICKSRGEFSRALEYYLKALKLDEELGNKKDIAAVTLNIGTVYSALEDYAKAREYFNRALAGAEEAGDKRTINVTKRCIGVLFRKQGILDSALFYYDKALKVAEEINDKSSISSLAADMGAAYYELGYYAKALAYSHKALQLKRELGAKTDAAVCLTTVGWTYIKLATDTSKKVKAFDVAELRAIDPAYTPMPREKHALLKKGIENIRESIAIFKEAGNMDDVASGYYNLARADSLNGDYHEALIAFCLSTRINDSLYSLKMSKEVATLGIRKQMENDSLNNVHGRQVMELKLKQQRNFTYLGIGGILLLLGVSFFIMKERAKSEKLLLNILPAEVATELKANGVTKAKHFDHVTVLFTDFVNFTGTSEQMSAQALIDELHACFKAFDEITAKYNIEKIKTIGDAYLAVCGLPAADPRHAENVVIAAKEIAAFMQDRVAKFGNKTFEIRLGIHSGSVVAGIVGVKKFAYDIWGDTVNTAARMEQNSEAGKINISETTYELVKDKFNCGYRGEIEAKGKGMMKMYYVSES